MCDVGHNRRRREERGHFLSVFHALLPLFPYPHPQGPSPKVLANNQPELSFIPAPQGRLVFQADRPTL